MVKNYRGYFDYIRFWKGLRYPSNEAEIERLCNPTFNYSQIKLKNTSDESKVHTEYL